MPGNNTLSILIVARHFPPSVSGGARRPFMWWKGFKDNGAQTFVIAPDLPEGVDGAVVPHPNPDPSIALPSKPTLRDHLRALLRWPDPDITWTHRAIKTAKQACPFHPDWIFTTSPPESVHVAGGSLKQHWRSARWVLDARDHWMIRAFRSERRNLLRRLIEPRLARHVLKRCDAFLAVNEYIEEEFKHFAPHARHMIVPHFAEKTAAPSSFPADTINLVHTGSFALSDPDVTIGQLLEPFESAVLKRPRLHLHLVGRLREDELLRVHRSPARGHISLHGIVPLATSHSMQAGADGLVIVAAESAPVPPGKYAEYVAAGKPILPIGNGKWRDVIGRSKFSSDVDALVQFDPSKANGLKVPEITPTSIVRETISFLGAE